MAGDAYKIFKDLRVWGVIDKAISDLVANHDLRETTNREYIVGYIVKCLTDSKTIEKETIPGNSTKKSTQAEQ